MRLNIDHPDPHTELKRWLPIVKRFLASPHYIVLVFLELTSDVVEIDRGRRLTPEKATA